MIFIYLIGNFDKKESQSSPTMHIKTYPWWYRCTLNERLNTVGFVDVTAVFVWIRMHHLTYLLFVYILVTWAITKSLWSATILLKDVQSWQRCTFVEIEIQFCWVCRCNRCISLNKVALCNHLLLLYLLVAWTIEFYLGWQK